MAKDAPIKQHQMEARGEGLMKSGDFDVSPYPGRNARTPMNEGDGSKMLTDSERGCGPAMKRGKGMMGVSRNPDHGPHDHFEAI
jgi:hypothetical protein